ncbi:TIGR03085 family protein [Mycobacterium gallinarum]|uniref:TIGR03085 family protein n=1 Tax=Mycobacterium gallinarum TaxID=39689 RepID=A0A9W4FHK4_9MYCO|nr:MULTISPECIES: TIGR03085 family metal-binding protein [Mycobacterium]MDV3135850.1 TIGR03085 family metal-binding protein [Mycobacterium sp. 29Ha]BBY95216.1 TIGR03085 family protein [Mycobacterium gallinarum]
MTAAQRERAALVATMSEIGPDAPTLCEGWTTRDLAAHLVVRERRLDAAPGIAIPFLAGYTDKVQRRTASSSGWDELVEKVSSGPPLLSPFKLLDSVANMDEMFIHHEDVRRAQPGWEPRSLDAETIAALRRPVGIMARLTMGKVPARVTLQTPEGETVAVVGSGPGLTVTGDIGELTMFVAGRDEARLTFSDAQAAQAVRAARRGL